MIWCCDSHCVQLHAQEHLPLVVTPMSTTNTVSDHSGADLQTFVARSFFFPTHHIHLMPSGGKDTFTATSASISLAPKLADFIMPQPPLTPHDTVFDPQAAATVSAWHTRSGHVLVKPMVNGQAIGYMLLDTGMFSFAHTSAAYALRKSAEYAVNTSAEYGFHTSAEYAVNTSAEYGSTLLVSVQSVLLLTMFPTALLRILYSREQACQCKARPSVSVALACHGSCTSLQSATQQADTLFMHSAQATVFVWLHPCICVSSNMQAYTLLLLTSRHIFSSLHVMLQLTVINTMLAMDLTCTIGTMMINKAAPPLQVPVALSSSKASLMSWPCHRSGRCMWLAWEGVCCANLGAPGS